MLNRRQLRDHQRRVDDLIRGNPAACSLANKPTEWHVWRSGKPEPVTGNGPLCPECGERHILIIKLNVVTRPEAVSC